MVVMPATFALIAAIAGNAAVMAGALLAQTASPGAADFAPWISGAGSMTAVAGLVYVARLMATGQLVARDPAAEAEQLKDALREVVRIAEAGGDRERAYHNLLVRRYESQSGRNVPRKDGD